MAGNTSSSRAPARRILLIERAFQVKFIAKVTAVVVLGTILTGGLLYLLADKEFGRAFYSAHYHARSSWELLLPSVLMSSFASMCCVAGIAVFLTLYDSHRIGGPLYRFRANLEKVARGDLTLLTRLREGDELQSLTEAMNEMTQSLATKVQSIRAAEVDLGRALSGVQDSVERGDETAQGRWREVSRARTQLQEALAAFRVPT